MKLTNLHRLLLLTAITAFGIYFVACNKASGEGKAKTPTEAFEQLYAAVHSKDTNRIKKVMSKSTLQFAESVAGQKNTTVEKVLENGFHRSTINEKLPAMRDERVKDKYGAVEVWVKKDNDWEDVRFVIEDGGFKLAVGETWAGSYVSPGKSRTIREQENANAAGKGAMIPYGNGNMNMNGVDPTIIKPGNTNAAK